MSVKVEEALDIIYKQTQKQSTILLPIEDVLGYVLAQDVVAKHNLPPYDNSAMDGYAVKLEDSGKCVKVKHTILAGDNSHEILESGYGIKIMTGARIPQGCESIVPIEDTKECEDGVILPQNIKPNNHIRECGEDIKSTKTLLKAGEKLYAHHITLLASQGISHIKVYKKIRVALFGSGSELKMHFENVTEYQLYNTNTPTFMARVKELDCEVDFIGTAEDSLESIKEHIKNALEYDFIVTSGGVSVGEADFTKEAFSSFGYEIYFDKVEIKPGKPTTFGRIGKTLVLNLPGNPLAAALNFELFGKAIIFGMSGVDTKYQNTIKTKMKDDYKLKAGRRTLVPGWFDGESFMPCSKFAPGMVSPLGVSNSFIMVDESCGFLACGSEVKIIPTRFEFNSKDMLDLVTNPQL
jgi:molybdopterin molybdotransferase